MASRQEASQHRIEPRLYLATDTVRDARAFAPLLQAALTAAEIVAVLLRLPPGGDRKSRIAMVETLATPVQEAGAALIINGDPDLAMQSAADGAHLTGIDAVTAAIGRLKPRLIAGAGGLKTRHDAMLAGESGVDYVMFGEPDQALPRPTLTAILERVAWWSEVFEVPCVGYAACAEEVRPLAQAGAEFVALGDFVWKTGGDPGELVAEAARHLRLSELI